MKLVGLANVGHEKDGRRSRGTRKRSEEIFGVIIFMAVLRFCFALLGTKS